MSVTLMNLDDVFRYRPPKGEDVERYSAIREAGKQLALVILEQTLPCDDQQAALRHVREAVMTANAAIAINGTV